VVIGLATLVKGPIGILLCLVPILAYCAAYRRWLPVGRWGLILGSAILTAMVWPFMLFAKGYGPSWFGEFIRGENFGKFAGVSMPFKILLIGLFGGLVPWTFLFVESLIRGIIGWRKFPEKRFALFWILGIFLIFSLPARKLPHYVMPAFPACAILIAATEEFSFFSIWGTRLLLVAIGLLLMTGSRIVSWPVSFMLLGAGLCAVAAGVVLNGKRKLALGLGLFGMVLLIYPIALPALEFSNQQAVVIRLTDEKMLVGVYAPDDRDPRGFEIHPRFVTLLTSANAIDHLRAGGILILPERYQKSLEPVGLKTISQWNVWKSGVGLGTVLKSGWNGDTTPIHEAIKAVKLSR